MAEEPEEKKMKIKTDGGIAEAQPLSDIQEYNIQLSKNTEALIKKNEIDKQRNIIEICKWVAIFLLIIIFALYIKYNNVVNNIVARCL